MDLQRITRHDVDDHFRVEAGVEMLGASPPRPKLVLFGRTSAVLAADARPRRADEPWLDHIVELIYLAQVLRPRGVAICFAMGPRDPAADLSFSLHVMVADRSLGRGCRIRHRIHGFRFGGDGMVTWQAPRSPQDDERHDAIAMAAMRRTRARRRHPSAVTRYLVQEGHRVVIAPSLSARVGHGGMLTVAP